jgi:hypothetical protein
MGVHPNLTLHWGESVPFNGEWGWFWRQSSGDGIYGLGSNLLRPVGTTQDTYEGSQAQVTFCRERDLRFRTVRPHRIRIRAGRSAARPLVKLEEKIESRLLNLCYPRLTPDRFFIAPFPNSISSSMSASMCAIRRARSLGSLVRRNSASTARISTCTDSRSAATK